MSRANPGEGKRRRFVDETIQRENPLRFPSPGFARLIHPLPEGEGLPRFLELHSS